MRVFAVLVANLSLLVAVMSGCGRTDLDPDDLTYPGDGGASSTSSSSSSSSGSTSSTSSTGGVTCGPSTCPTGCCDARGVCQSGRDVAACGALGAACSDCAANGFDACSSTRSCVRNDAGCGPASCPTGCCQADSSGNLQCVQGTSDGACGQGGGSCVNCAATGTSCDPSSGTCGAAICDASNCNGCCIGNSCLPGDSTFACGSSGAQCGTCGQNQTCQAMSSGGGQCVGDVNPCGPQNCGGCCQNGTCFEGTDQGACGLAGETCLACAPDETCDQNSRTCTPIFTACGPDNCGGCCDGDICQEGTDPFDCGVGGGACNFCFGQQTCQAGQCVQTGCNADTCPNGCCNGDQCVTGIANDACGTGGDVCTNCRAEGAFCDGLVTPRRCSVDQSECPATYPGCAPGTTTPVQPDAQNICSTDELDAIAVACSNGPNSPFCQPALDAVGDCGSCLAPFDYPFAEQTGLYACAASFVGTNCRRNMGCASDCAAESCDSCDAAATDQCVTLVDGQGGQCRAYAQAASCANNALSAGQLCSQFSYANYGAWLRAVGRFFCGDGD